MWMTDHVTDNLAATRGRPQPPSPCSQIYHEDRRQKQEEGEGAWMQGPTQPEVRRTSTPTVTAGFGRSRRAVSDVFGPLCVGDLPLRLLAHRSAYSPVPVARYEKKKKIPPWRMAGLVFLLVFLVLAGACQRSGVGGSVGGFLSRNSTSSVIAKKRCPRAMRF